MLLKFELPQLQQQLLKLEEKETIRYCIPYDIAEDGSFKEDGYVVVTDTRLFVLDSEKITYEHPLSGFDKMKCEPGVNSGIWLVKQKDEDFERRLVRFSMRHMSRASFCARGAMILGEGGTKQLESREYEKVCLKCGHALPGTRQCPHCEGRMISFRKLGNLFSNYVGRLLVMTLVTIAAAGIFLYTPHYQKVYIDRDLVDKSGTLEGLLIFTIVMFSLTAVQIIINVVKNWCFVSLGAKISMDIRRRMYEKIQDLSLSFIQDRRPGELMNRIMRDTNVVKDFLIECFGHMTSQLITMVGATAIMLSLDVKMTLISIIFMPIATAISILFRKNIHRRFHLQWLKGDKINSSLQDVISGIRVVKSFGKEQEESEKFLGHAEDFAQMQSRNEVFWASFYPMLTFIMSMGIYFVIYMGGVKVLGGNMTVGSLIQFNSYAWVLYGPLQWMTHFPRRVTQMLTSLERIYDVLDEEPLIRNSVQPIKEEIQGEVEFKGVTFGYRSYEPVLEKIDLKIKKGEMIGLVGASGTGKSTMINLIMRLYEVDDGAILIDGKNINDLDIENYHSQLGVVLQETFLFTGTIMNNIRFSKPDATDEEVIRAAKMANAHDFICKTPDGYNTYVGEHGYTISGGERQRIAIARAILNNPKLLILDEATSSLDTESEYLIQKALERLTAGRTTIAIAHRLSTLRGANRLVVIDGHHIAEIGTHNELMEKKGIYYNLVTAQLEMQSLKESTASEEAAASKEGEPATE